MSIPLLGGVVAFSLASTVASQKLIDELLNPFTVAVVGGAVVYDRYQTATAREKLKDALASSTAVDVALKQKTVTKTVRRRRGKIGFGHRVLFNNHRLVRRKWARG